MKRTLVVYYSRTGLTRRIACEIGRYRRRSARMRPYQLARLEPRRAAGLPLKKATNQLQLVFS
jgi:hypothetical protein